MQDPSGSNYELSEQTVFAAMNQYFLLFFSVSCVLSSVFIQELFLMADQFQLGISIAPLIGIVLPIFLLTRRFQGGFVGQLKFARPQPIVVALVFVGTLAVVVIVDFLYVFSQLIMPEPEGYTESLRMIKPSDPLSFILTFTGLCLAVPIAEEVIFRGMIQQVFSRNMTPFVSIGLSGIFFGVIHFNPQLLLSMAFFGVFLGYIFHLTRNINYAIISHGALNLVAFLQLTFMTDENMTDAPFYLQSYLMLVLAIAVIAGVLFLIKKRSLAGGSRIGIVGRTVTATSPKC